MQFFCRGKFAIDSCQLIVAALMCLTPSLGDGAEYSLKQIRDTLREEFSSILSIDVKSSQSFQTNNPEIAPSIHQKVEWCVDGTKRATFFNVPGEQPTWSIKAFDGEWTQAGLMTSLEPRKVKFLQKYMGEHPRVLKPPLFALAFGFVFLNEPGNLVTLLENPNVKLVGPEPMDGHDCLKIESAEVLSRGHGTVYRYTMWLDPSVRCLPRRLVCRFDPSSRDYEKTTVQGKYAEVANYQLLDLKPACPGVRFWVGA